MQKNGFIRYGQANYCKKYLTGQMGERNQTIGKQEESIGTIR
jgi:hypothetical protein